MIFQKSTTWLLAVLIALGCYFYFFEIKNDSEKKEQGRNIIMEAMSMLSTEEINKKNEKKREDKDLKRVFSFNEDEVVGIKLIKENQIVFAQKEGKEWKIVGSVEKIENKNIISSFVSTLTKLVEVRIIDENPSDLEEYGLKIPHFEVLMEIKDYPSPITLLLGKNNPNTTCVYAKTKDSPQVILVGSLIKFELETVVHRLFSDKQ